MGKGTKKFGLIEYESGMNRVREEGSTSKWKIGMT